MSEMNPEEKKKADAYLKSVGSEYTAEQLEAMRARAIRTMGDWCIQDPTEVKNLPVEVQDMRCMARYALLTSLTGMMPLSLTMSTVDMAVEAAYNLGKAAQKPTPKPKTKRKKK